MRKALTVVAVLAVTLVAAQAATAAQATPISRANAVRTAKQYLQTSGFSFKGLVSQLKYEGYSTSDARYGVSHSGANWYRQAVRVAKGYLRTMPFSRSGLIQQLEYDGFTHSQAVYGVASHWAVSLSGTSRRPEGECIASGRAGSWEAPGHSARAHR